MTADEDDQEEPQTPLSPYHRVASGLRQLQETYGDELSLEQMLELAIEEQYLVLVESVPQAMDGDLERALRGWIFHTRPISGIGPQSMQATMAYNADRQLRAIAAHHLIRR